VESVIDSSQTPPVINFSVKTGKGEIPEGTVNRKGAVCICCQTPVAFDYIRNEGKAGRMQADLMAIVAEGKKERVYISPDDEHINIAVSAKPEWKPNTNLPEQALGFRVQLYGMTQHADLFTNRQLVALTTFSDLVSEAREKVKLDAINAGIVDDNLPLCEGGKGATAYADAVATYLGFGVSRMANTLCTIARWTASRDQTVTAFARQAIPMTWDYPDVNPFANAAGDIAVSLASICDVIKSLPTQVDYSKIIQLDATFINQQINHPIISTDPPYYDNIGYADLADFFYVWLRRSIGKIY
ncbi:MAG: hypothetical protein ACKPA7_32490, partial [Sphaerospermopsis kisseleviana]